MIESDGVRAAWSAEDVLASIVEPLYALDAEWRFAYVNEAAERLLGRRADELLGRIVWDEFPEVATGPVPAVYQEAIASGETARLTLYYPPLDRWFSVTATPQRGVLFVSFHNVDDLKRAEAEIESLAAEHGALRRVATAVAREAPAEELFGLVARETAGVLGAAFGGVAKYVEEGIEVVGSWSDGSRCLAPGTVAPVVAGTELDRLRRNRSPIRSIASDRTADFGYAVSLSVPIEVEARIWGGLSVAAHDPGALPPGSEQWLADIAELLATAVSHTEARLQLAAQASLDALTGLANHAAFHRCVEIEAGRALRHGRPLALAVIDVDHFKFINDSRGHQVGDRVLEDIARRLSSVVRSEDVLGRIGGDEFALLLPETTAVEAHAVIERARELVAAEPLHDRTRVSISAGVCDVGHARSADDLLRLADTALYWSKAHGRNVAWVYDPVVLDELGAEERESRIEQAQALTGIRALARAIDAKDTSTREHSERVAALSAAIAEEAGWTPVESPWSTRRRSSTTSARSAFRTPSSSRRSGSTPTSTRPSSRTPRSARRSPRGS